MRRRSLLLVALACFGCAGPRQPLPTVVSPAVALPSAGVARAAPPLRVPLEARAVYSGVDNAMLGLVEVDGRTLLVSPQLVAPARVQKSSQGYVLHPARLAEVLEGETQPAMPEALELLTPTPGGSGWQLDVGGQGRFAQLTDRWATRLSVGLDQLELGRVDLQGLEVLGWIRHYLHLLRDQPAEELREIVSSLDPDWVKSKGGVRAYVAEQLWMELEKLRPAAEKNELVELERYVEMAKGAAYKGRALWPETRDAFVAKLAERLSRSEAKVTIRDGALIRIDTKDRKGVLGCDLGIMLPEPTENRARPWAPFTPPSAGKLGAFTYVMLVLQSGLPGTCERLRPGESAHPVRRGLYYLRLIADAQARVRGALFVGYMAAELYVVKGASEAEIMSMVQASSDEISHQAE